MRNLLRGNLMSLTTTLRGLIYIVAIQMLLFSQLPKAQTFSPGPPPAPTSYPTGYSVNIRTFGAVGDGNNDDTAAIQAAIDYAYNHNIQGIFCPSGTYKTTRTIYLDPPRNLRSNFSDPPLFDFSLAFNGPDGGLGDGNGYMFGCRIQPTFNNGIAFIIGSGQHMKVSGISVLGPNSVYRGKLNPLGVGIGIAGGRGGAHHTLIENTFVANFYALYQTDSNSACCLADSNSFHGIAGDNGYYGVQLKGTQSFINRIEEPILHNVTIGISDSWSHQTTVTGGNISAVSGAAGSFGISSISGLSPASDGGFTFTGVISSPDSNIPNVYNSFTILTQHFGVIPLTLNSWNAGTNTGTFETTPAWTTANFGRIDLHNTGLTDIGTEIAAVTTIFATERVTIANGFGISLEGVHVKNPNACQTLYYLTNVWLGAASASIKNVYFNSDPGLTVYAPANNPSSAQLALFYCQQTFPFIGQQLGLYARLDIDGGDFGQHDYVSRGVSAPLLLEVFPGITLSGRGLDNLAPLNERVSDTIWYSYRELGGFNQIDTQFNGAGDWDNNYFLPHALIDSGTWPASCGVACYITQGHLAVPYRGYRPAPGQKPNLSPDIYALVHGSLGALGTYPPIDCETVYHSVGYYSGPLSHVHLRSASCPGYSWGQNLTNTLVGGTVTWSYKGQSAMLYLDAKTLSWMFPGLGLTIPGSFNSDAYVVTGVYPQLGYVTVVDATTAASGNPSTSGGGPLQGDPHAVYSCSSGCSIGQAAYSWTEY
jgi:hypothetical protein